MTAAQYAREARLEADNGRAHVKAGPVCAQSAAEYFARASAYALTALALIATGQDDDRD